jgi:hypothetical protein
MKSYRASLILSGSKDTLGSIATIDKQQNQRNL